MRLNNRDFIVPVPICPDCGGVYVPKNFESVINVGLDVQFQAAVVNGNGDVVAKTTASNVAQVLNFNPAPFSKLRAVGAASAQADDPLPYSRAAAADELRYYLLVEPVPGTDASHPHALSLALSGAIKEPATTTAIFLPLIRTQP